MEPHSINDAACESLPLLVAHESRVEEVLSDPPQTSSDRYFGQYKYRYRNQKARVCGKIIKKWNSGPAQGQAFDK